MKSPSQVTFWVVIALTVGIGVFDFVMLKYFGSDATISGVIWHLIAEYPPIGYILAFAVGALFGHLFLR